MVNLDFPVAREREIDIGPATLHVAEYGRVGPPLVLLHGIGSRGASWFPVLARLAQDFRLIVPDMRGHGQSSTSETGYLTEDYAGDLGALIELYGLEKPMLLGHSLGGLTVLRWAGEHPDAAARIVLEDAPLRYSATPAATFDDWIAFASLSVDQAAARYRREHPAWTAEECARRAVSITSTHPAVFREMRDRPDRDDVFASIARIQTPMLLIHGDTRAGGLVTDEEASQFNATAPRGAVHRIENGSHALHRDFSDAFLAAAIPFLKGQTATAIPV